MARVTVFGATSDEYIRAMVVCETTAGSAEENVSSVRQKLYYKRTTSGSTISGTGTFTCHYKFYNSATGKWDGSITQHTKTIKITSDDWVLAAVQTHEAPHNDDGTGTLLIYWDGVIPGTTLKSTDVYETVTLDTIPRASSIDSLSCATSYFTGALTYQYTPKAQSLYNRCDISLNLDGEYIPVKKVKLGRQAASQQTATILLLDQLDTVYTSLPNTTRGKLRFTLRTFSDSEYTNPVGEAGYKEITLTIPNDDSTQPTVTMKLSPVSDFTGGGEIYVKGLSKVKAAFTDYKGKYGATPVSYKMNVEAKDYGSPYDTPAYLTSAYLTTTGSITVKGTITDSRGFSRTYSQTISVIDYTTPTIDLVSCNTQYFTGSVSFKYTPANNVFYSRCVVALNIGGTLPEVRTIDLGVRDAGQKTETFTFIAEEIDKIYNNYTSSTKGTLRFTYSTYSDDKYSDEVGSATYKEITLSIPNDDTTKPTAELKVSPVSSLKPAFKDLYIKGKTKAEATLVNDVGKYGAEIKSYKVTIGAQSGTPPLTSSYLTQAGNVTVTGTVKDSRGFSRTESTTINVIDYSSPQILPVSGQSSVIVARSDSDGKLDENGEHLFIAAKRGYNKVVSDGEQTNFCSMQCCYKKQGDKEYGDWIEILAREALSDEVILKRVPGVTLDTKSTYIVQVQVKDDIGETVTTTTHISTQKIYMHRSGTKNSLAIGKYAEEENTVDIAEDMTAIFRGDVQFMGEAWTQLNLSDVAVSDAKIGRCGNGAYYRVCAGGKHIYVAFNVSFSAKDGSTISVTKAPIPEDYRPPFDVYAVCPVGFNGGIKSTAIVGVTPGGIVNIYTVNRQLSTMTDVAWIDGYIDYWIKEEEK